MMSKKKKAKSAANDGVKDDESRVTVDTAPTQVIVKKKKKISLLGTGFEPIEEIVKDRISHKSLNLNIFKKKENEKIEEKSGKLGGLSLFRSNSHQPFSTSEQKLNSPKHHIKKFKSLLK